MAKTAALFCVWMVPEKDLKSNLRAGICSDRVRLLLIADCQFSIVFVSSNSIGNGLTRSLALAVLLVYYFFRTGAVGPGVFTAVPVGLKT